MIFAVDTDGTTHDHRYPDLGREVPDAARVLKRLVKAGHELILFTMRSGVFLDPIVAWYLNEHQIPLLGVNENPDQHTWTESPKVYAHRYIGDDALGCPLMQLAWMRRPCVDWVAVEKLLEAQGFLEVTDGVG